MRKCMHLRCGETRLHVSSFIAVHQQWELLMSSAPSILTQCKSGDFLVTGSKSWHVAFGMWVISYTDIDTAINAASRRVLYKRRIARIEVISSIGWDVGTWRKSGHRRGVYLLLLRYLGRPKGLDGRKAS